jgi:hypothetical protein
MVKKLTWLLLIPFIVGCGSMKTTTDKEIIETKDISTVSNYTDSLKYAVQVINVDMTKVLALFPEDQDKELKL